MSYHNSNRTPPKPEFLQRRKDKPRDKGFKLLFKKILSIRYKLREYLPQFHKHTIFEGEQKMKYFFQTRKQRIADAKEDISLAEGFMETLNIMHNRATRDIERSKSSLIKGKQSLDYFTTNRQRFESDYTKTFKWQIPNTQEIIDWKVIPDPESRLPYGYALYLRNSIIKIEFNYGDIGKEGFNISAENLHLYNYNTQDLGKLFLAEMERINHYIVQPLHQREIQIKILPTAVYNEKFSSYDQVLELLDILSDPDESMLGPFQREMAITTKVMGETTKELINQRRKLKALENDKSFEAWIARIIGDKHKIQAFDLINIIRVDRLFIAWFLLTLRSIVLVFQVIYYLITLGISKIAELTGKS